MADFNNNGLLTVIYFTVSESSFELSKTFRLLCLKFHASSKFRYVRVRCQCVSLQHRAKCEDQKSNMWSAAASWDDDDVVLKIIIMMMMIIQYHALGSV